MAYVDSTLGTGESVEYIAHRHWIVFVVPVLVASLLIVSPPVLPFGLLWVFWTWLVRKTTELAVTSKKVVGKWGIISRQTVEQRLEKIDSIQVDQGIVGRVLGYGTIRVHGSGTTTTPIPLISDPVTFRRRVEDAIERNQITTR